LIGRQELVSVMCRDNKVRYEGTAQQSASQRRPLSYQCEDYACKMDASIVFQDGKVCCEASAYNVPD
jgi:hypothetical protein